MNLGLLAQSTITTDTTTVTLTSAESTGLLGALAAMWIVWVAVLVLSIVASWKIFEKAGEAGWKSIVPFYNSYTLFRIAGRNGWGFLLLLIPLVNIVVIIMVMLDLAKHFGKSSTFAVFGLILFNTIGMLMLGFGDAKYVGTKHA